MKTLLFYLALFVIVMAINYSSSPISLGSPDKRIGFHLGIAVFAGAIGVVVSLASSAIFTALAMLTQWGSNNKGQIFRHVSIGIVVLVIIQSLILMTARNAIAESADNEIAAFKGIDSVYVVADIGDDCPQLADAEDSFKTLIELKLRQNGIKVISISFGTPYVYLNVNAFATENINGCFGNVLLELREDVFLSRSGQFVISAATWNTSKIWTSPPDTVREYLRSSVDEQMDQFLNAYFKANPRQ